MGFARRYGSAHITLAMHAALPLGLTPDMLHLIRINFVPEAPWIAEADVLLSPLFREVGGELYEMPPDTRELLLDELTSDPEFGRPRLKEVAGFVHEYSMRALRVGGASALPEMRDFYEAQQWVALAHISPDEAAQSLASALKENLQAQSQAGVLRVARLTQELAAPLISQESIVLYSTALEKLAAGDKRQARDFFAALGPLNQAVSIGRVELPAPVNVFPASPPPINEHPEPKRKEARRNGKASIFSVDVLRARNGDCLILHYGSPKDPGLVLIDGGPRGVYKPYLKPRLLQIKNARGLHPNDPLIIDTLMVSHASSEHIQGILELTKELLEAREQHRPKPFEVLSCWHNSIEDIFGNSPNELIAGVTAQFGAAALSGEAEVEDLDPDTAKILASVGMGSRLRDDMRKLNLPLNPEFDSRLVLAKKKASKIDMGKGLVITVIGPMKDEVMALQKAHDMFLKTAIEKKTSGTLADYIDAPIANSYSIVVLAEVSHKSILLTGDARSDKLSQGLEQAGLLKKDVTSKFHVDILKVPQHGSNRSMDPMFFDRVTADHYIISGDGEGGTPERETLEMLMEIRGDEDYIVHFTYPITEIDERCKQSWEKQRDKERRRRNLNPNTSVRPAWSNKSHSLQSLIKGNPKFAKKISIVPDDQPHTINLLDEV